MALEETKAFCELLRQRLASEQQACTKAMRARETLTEVPRGVEAAAKCSSSPAR